ncbi:centractin- actin- protein of the dynactin complex [Entomortierella beljakovae]|nr:centractin- actin- protein of the dynactin complex [Entomortierella beljakovae]
MDLQTVVIENGSGLTKAGFSGEQKPHVLFPTVVGKPSQGDSFIGKEAMFRRGILNLKFPVEYGVTTNWDDLELIWRHTFQKLNVVPEERPVLLTDSPLNSKSNREKMAQVMFETFNVPALYISNQAELALFASGRKTGVVLDVGDSSTHTVPIYDGNTISDRISYAEYGGRELTQYLSRMLTERGIMLSTIAEREVLRNIKEMHCYVASNFDAEMEAAPTFSSIELPDGHHIEIGIERFRCPELLFHPAFMGMEYNGIHGTLYETINKCDATLQKDLYSNIVLSGGSTMFNGLAERIENELKLYAPESMEIKVHSPPNRQYGAWLGGSLLASHATFQQMLISKKEYEESGPSIIHRKST